MCIEFRCLQPRLGGYNKKSHYAADWLELNSIF
jgi:hypothetical protein